MLSKFSRSVGLRKFSLLSQVKKRAKTKKERKTKVVKVIHKQTGKRKSIKVDRKRPALPPGYRVTEWGSVYRETRRNRSDLKNRI